MKHIFLIFMTALFCNSIILPSTHCDNIHKAIVVAGATTSLVALAALSYYSSPTNDTTSTPSNADINYLNQALCAANAELETTRATLLAIPTTEQLHNVTAELHAAQQECEQLRSELISTRATLNAFQRNNSVITCWTMLIEEQLKKTIRIITDNTKNFHDSLQKALDDSRSSADTHAGGGAFVAASLNQ